MEQKGLAGRFCGFVLEIEWALGLMKAFNRSGRGKAHRQRQQRVPANSRARCLQQGHC